MFDKGEVENRKPIFIKVGLLINSFFVYCFKGSCY